MMFKNTTKKTQEKGDWEGFRMSIGSAIQGKKVDNKFLKANKSKEYPATIEEIKWTSKSVG